MRRLLAALTLAVLPQYAQAQDFLTQAEVEDVLRLNAFCYAPQDDGTCTWAEVYELTDTPRFTLEIGVITEPGVMITIHQQATWINDAMCIRDGDLGVLGSSRGQAPEFPFSGGGSVPQSAQATQALVANIAANIQPKTCFRFARDPARPGGMLQFTFADGTPLDGSDVIRLVPLSQGSVRLYSPF